MKSAITKAILAFLFIITAVLVLTDLADLVFRQTGYISQKIFFVRHAVDKGQGTAITQIASAAKMVMPQGACIETSFHKSAPLLENVAFKYYLFPLKVSDHWPNAFNKEDRSCNGRYFIDLHDSINETSVSWKRIAEFDAGTIFEIERPTDQHQFAELRFDNLSLALYMFYVALIMGTGILLLGAFFHDLAGMPLSAKLSTAFLLGLSVTTLLLWPLALSKIPLSHMLISTILNLSFGCAYVLFMRRGVKFSSFFNFKSPVVDVFFLDLLCGAVLLLYFAFSLSFPIGVWDEMHIWLLKAKMFYYAQGLAFDYTQYNNNYYPILYPLNLTMQYVFTGGAFDEIAKATSAILLLCIAGQIKCIGWVLGLNRRISTIALLAFLLCFHHWTFFTALAENIFIALMLVSIAFFMDWMKSGKKPSLFLASVTLAMLSGVKYEGWLVTVFVGIAYMLSEARPFTNIIFRLKNISWLACAIGVHFFWVLWTKFVQVPYDVFHLHQGVSFGNLPILMTMSIEFLKSGPTLAILLFVFVSLVLIKPRYALSLECRFLLALCGCFIIFACFAGICWPVEDFRLYYPEVLTRLFSRCTPLLVILYLLFFMKNATGKERI